MSTSKKLEEKLDDALDQSYPASDPPAQSQPVKKVGARRGRSADEVMPSSERKERRGKR
ncbi:MAG TPA: hypothetical protein VF449_05905 [Parvibaculum sp.]